MEAKKSTLLEDVATYVSQYINAHIPKQYTYHDLQHTLNVVHSAQEIASYFSLEAEDYEALTLAA